VEDPLFVVVAVLVVILLVPVVILCMILMIKRGREMGVSSLWSRVAEVNYASNIVSSSMMV